MIPVNMDWELLLCKKRDLLHMKAIPCQRQYAQREKEMLAIVYGLEKFHHYTYGKYMKVLTDHKPFVQNNYQKYQKGSKTI